MWRMLGVELAASLAPIPRSSHSNRVHRRPGTLRLLSSDYKSFKVTNTCLSVLSCMFCQFIVWNASHTEVIEASSQ